MGEIQFSVHGNFKRTEKWLSSFSANKFESLLKDVGDDGVQSLKSNTPVGDTGETANSWNYKLDMSKGFMSLSWFNTAHPNTESPVAILLDRGHGTRNGGYVPARPYIRQSMSPVYKKASGAIRKEVLK